MSYEQKGNITITLNVYKQEDQPVPDYKGKMVVDGRDYVVSLWVNNNIHGVPVHMSGQISKIV